MIDIETLSNEDKLTLLTQLEQHFGWNPVAAVCVEDVKQALINLELEDGEMPTQANIAYACKYVARKADVDINDLIDWAVDVAQELQTKETTA